MQTAMNWCKSVTFYKIPYLPSAVCNKAISMVGNWVPEFNEYDIRKKCVGGGLCYNFNSI